MKGKYGSEVGSFRAFDQLLYPSLCSPTTIMAKGKSRTNFTGVSRFLDAFETDTGSPSSYQTPDSTAKETDDETRPTKKRKTSTPNPLPPDSAYKSYDATGLVPFYTESSQVPEDLQKCTCPLCRPPPLRLPNRRIARA